LAGSNGDAETVFNVTQLPSLASDSGLVVISLHSIPYKAGVLWLNDATYNYIELAINKAFNEYKIPRSKCIMGGFSGGGIIALSYCELAYEGNKKTDVKPVGVFTLSSPIDIEDLYLAFKRDIDSTFCNRKISRESIYQEERMRKEIGTPSTKYENYVKYSPYLMTHPNGGRAIFLKDISVRCLDGINGKDVANGVEECESIDDSNFRPMTKFLAFLRKKGNQRAYFIDQYAPEYIPDGGEKLRCKHNWASIDSKECVNWIMSLINKN